MILQRLNMDNSWHLEMRGMRLLVDPWLEGAEIDVAGWFNRQWHRTPPVSWASVPEYDAVLITQRYPDHCHFETLKRLRPKVVLAPVAVKKNLMNVLPDSSFNFFDSANQEYRISDVEILRLATRRRLPPFYDAFLIDDGTEAVLIANHGFQLDERHKLEIGSRDIDVLLSPLNHYQLPVLLGGTVSPGLDGLSRLVEQTNPKH